MERSLQSARWVFLEYQRERLTSGELAILDAWSVWNEKFLNNFSQSSSLLLSMQVPAVWTAVRVWHQDWPYNLSADIPGGRIQALKYELPGCRWPTRGVSREPGLRKQLCLSSTSRSSWLLELCRDSDTMILQKLHQLHEDWLLGENKVTCLPPLSPQSPMCGRQSSSLCWWSSLMVISPRCPRPTGGSVSPIVLHTSLQSPRQGHP